MQPDQFCRYPQDHHCERDAQADRGQLRQECLAVQDTRQRRVAFYGCPSHCNRRGGYFEEDAHDTGEFKAAEPTIEEPQEGNRIEQRGNGGPKREPLVAHYVDQNQI